MKQALKDYRTVLTIRFFEEKVEDLFARGVVRGALPGEREAPRGGLCPPRH